MAEDIACLRFLTLICSVFFDASLSPASSVESHLARLYIPFDGKLSRCAFLNAPSSRPAPFVHLLDESRLFSQNQSFVPCLES